jgi:ribosomal protein L20
MGTMFTGLSAEVNGTVYDSMHSAYRTVARHQRYLCGLWIQSNELNGTLRNQYQQYTDLLEELTGIREDLTSALLESTRPAVSGAND